MKTEITLSFITTIILASWQACWGQQNTPERLDSLEARVNRIEATLDTLLAYQRGRSTIQPEGTILSDDSNLRWGIISETGTILDKQYFVLNHNDAWKIPRWAAYYLSSGLLHGNQGRTDDFRPDPQLPTGSRAELSDYRNSGYDRGHNAPAGAFKRSREAMSTTFLLSNMSPQTPKLNRGIWKTLEDEVRDMINETGEAWIITGNIFMSADSQFIEPFEFIGNNHVAVPTHCFKAILASREDGTFRTYAFLIPNSRDSIPGKPSNYILSVDRLEQITGYDFFPILEDDLENQLESIVADSWQ